MSGPRQSHCVAACRAARSFGALRPRCELRHVRRLGFPPARDQIADAMRKGSASEPLRSVAPYREPGGETANGLTWLGKVLPCA